MTGMERVGRYRVERRLGAGAFSTVWLARDDALEIPVAVKVLSENWVEHAEMRSRFLDEARLLRRITDPGIVGVHDLGRLPDGRDYFVMDYIAGGTLADLCRNPVDAATAIRLGADLARAVAVLHRHGILHRDLKPENVLLTGTQDESLPVIADLGTAKRLAEASGLTVAAGTPAYMAPEQARGMGLDERSDVYAITAVCYRMITGVVPFPDETLTGVANRPGDRRPEPIDGSLDLPDGLAALLFAGLTADPDRRPPSAAELADELDSIGRGDPAVAARRSLGPARSPARPAPARARTAVGLLLVGCLAAASTWLLLSLLVTR